MSEARAGAVAASAPAAVYWGALVAIGLAWGMTGPLSKLAISTGHHPVGVTLWNTLIGAALLNGALLVRGGRLPLDRRHLVFYLVCGLSGTALPNSISYTTYQHLPVGVIVMVISLVPMCTMALALVAGVERAEPRRLLGIALGAGAIALIALPESSLPEPEKAVWVLAAVVVSLSYAFENVYIAARTPPGCSAFQTMCGLSLGALLLLAPTALATDAFFDITAFGPPELAVVAISFLHVGAYFGYVWLIPRTGPAFASLVGYVVTGAGVVLGMAIYGERHSPWVWAALGLMFLGIALVRPRR